MECLLSYLCMVTVPHIMVGLERMSDYRGVRLARFTVVLLFVLVKWNEVVVVLIQIVWVEFAVILGWCFM